MRRMKEKGQEEKGNEEENDVEEHREDKEKGGAGCTPFKKPNKENNGEDKEKTQKRESQKTSGTKKRAGVGG